MGIKENFLNLIIGVYGKPAFNVIFNSKRPNTFPLRSRKDKDGHSH